MRRDKIDKQSYVRFSPEPDLYDADTAYLHATGNGIRGPGDKATVLLRYDNLIVRDKRGIELSRDFVDEPQCKIRLPAARRTCQHSGPVANRNAGSVDEKRIRMHVAPQAGGL